MKIKYYFKKACIRLFEYTKFNSLLRSISDWYETKYNSGEKVSNPPLSGWSIIVITDGNNSECLDLCIESVQKELEGSPYEIIIVGPPRLKINPSHDKTHLIHFPYKELLLWGVPGFISRKKNLGASISKYDKLVVTHDYITFTQGWKKGFDEYGGFTVGTNIILNKDGSRHRDWMTWDYPEIGQALVPYNKSCNEYQYLNGSYFIVKRNFFLDNPIGEESRWGEGEDVWWSMKIRKIATFSINTLSTIQYSKQKSDPSQKWSEKNKLLAELLNK